MKYGNVEVLVRDNANSNVKSPSLSWSRSLLATKDHAEQDETFATRQGLGYLQQAMRMGRQIKNGSPCTTFHISNGAGSGAGIFAFEESGEVKIGFLSPRMHLTGQETKRRAAAARG